MSNIKELIRAEIERRKNKWLAASRLVKKGKDTAMYAAGKSSAYTELLSFLDTLPDESEQPTRGYDEAYLNEKIAKASKSWEGVDVDKFMDEVRGREPVTDCHDLTEAAEKYANRGISSNADPYEEIIAYQADKDAFKAGAEWQKRKMMEGAVEGVVWGNVGKNINISVLKGACKYLEQDDLPYNVRIIILPKEGEQ